MSWSWEVKQPNGWIFGGPLWRGGALTVRPLRPISLWFWEV